MINEKERQKLLKELERTGNVGISCLKLGIHRSTYYRWRKADKWFKKKADEMLRHGRESNVDIAEQALMLQVKKGNFPAIRYVLSRLSQRYKPQERKITISHERSSPEIDLASERQRKQIDETTEGLKKLIEDIAEETAKEELSKE